MQADREKIQINKRKYIRFIFIKFIAKVLKIA